ncbi:hypothetical protein QJQ45_003660 [Haematococcus lacustris]|nr:hypothetical protein QJQ45_003660 [Haematococcus lacustris]
MERNRQRKRNRNASDIVVDRELEAQPEPSKAQKNKKASGEARRDRHDINTWHAKKAKRHTAAAQRVLCIPATATANERVFSSFKHIWSDKRSSLLLGCMWLLAFIYFNKRVLERKPKPQPEAEWQQFAQGVCAAGLEAGAVVASEVVEARVVTQLEAWVEACSMRALLGSLLLGLAVRGWFTRLRGLPDGQEVFEEIPAEDAVIPNLANRNMYLQLVRGLPPPGRRSSQPSEAVEDVLAFYPGLHARLTKGMCVR